MAATIRATTWLTAPLLAEITTAWIESGQAAAMADWKRDEIGARYALAREILEPWLQASLEPCFHLWISLPDPWRTETFVARARDRGVVVNSAEEFMVGRQNPLHAVRVCLGATLSRERLEDGLKRLATLLTEVPEPSLTVY